MELLTNPITYIVGFIILALALEFRKNGFKNSSPKSSEPNKTSYKKKPTYASSGLPKQKNASTTKKTPKKKTATKKTATKRTNKKGASKN
tara:strand:- start:373 stop:642 length:270 start_codon:yes stop_codon:yes gene_type:complete